MTASFGQWVVLLAAFVAGNRRWASSKPAGPLEKTDTAATNVSASNQTASPAVSYKQGCQFLRR